MEQTTPITFVIHGPIYILPPNSQQFTNLFTTQLTKIMADLTALTAAVQQETTVDAAAVTLIEGIVAELKNSSGNQAAVDALTAQLESAVQPLSQAVAANTPAQPGTGSGTPTPTPGQ